MRYLLPLLAVAIVALFIISNSKGCAKSAKVDPRDSIIAVLQARVHDDSVMIAQLRAPTQYHGLHDVFRIPPNDTFTTIVPVWHAPKVAHKHKHHRKYHHRHKHHKVKAVKKVSCPCPCGSHTVMPKDSASSYHAERNQIRPMDSVVTIKRFTLKAPRPRVGPTVIHHRMKHRPLTASKPIITVH